MAFDPRAHRLRDASGDDAKAANTLTFLAANDIPVTRQPRADLKIDVSGERGGRPPRNRVRYPPRASAARRFDLEW